jgi:hypothetical protein
VVVPDVLLVGVVVGGDAESIDAGPAEASPGPVAAGARIFRAIRVTVRAARNHTPGLVTSAWGRSMSGFSSTIGLVAPGLGE